MSLQQQIQREIDEEARIDRLIEKKRHKILRFPENRKYRFVDNKNKAHAFLVIDRNELTKYGILAYEEEETITKLESAPNISIFPLRNTNPRDSIRSTVGSIRSGLIPYSDITINNS